MKKLGLAVLATGMVLGLGLNSAYADPVTLNLNQDALGCVGGANCGTALINQIDLAPGNSIGVNVIPAGGGVLTTVPFQVYFQAQLASFRLNNAAVFSPEFETGFPQGAEVTAVAGFQEVVSGSGLGNAAFSFVAGGNNFFELYYDTHDANDLAGTGFNDGTAIPLSPGGHPTGQILHGTIIGGSGTFQATGTDAQLDHAGADNYPGIGTVTGNGSSRVIVKVDYLNPRVFSSGSPVGIIDPVTGAVVTPFVLSLNFDTTNSVPFISVDPSLNFWDGSALFAHNIGTTNGFSGKDFQFQTDANGNFEVGAVPEPATLTLLGLGLLGSSAARRRQKKAKQ